MKKNILVLCTGNSCRSQIAHAYFAKYASAKANIYSAGIETHGLNPNAVATLKADGIDISSYTSNNVNEYLDVNFDLILTVCDNAKESCPVFPSTAKLVHHSFPDPAKFTGTDIEVAQGFAVVREEIETFVLELLIKEGLAD